MEAHYSKEEAGSVYKLEDMNKDGILEDTDINYEVRKIISIVESLIFLRLSLMNRFQPELQLFVFNRCRLEMAGIQREVTTTAVQKARKTFCPLESKTIKVLLSQ
ncbi:hypothetical protein EV702DRAFT_1048996 [Suillus placidus]|uniref:EF-hand domain-containing protein n=1 Tax=Suillus placidus TaxID=48579 RepID=A0A9P7CYH3_9AGAM|nr:hypothetical protein EV702DRAFT_1048996 [Suillus placidus]